MKKTAKLFTLSAVIFFTACGKSKPVTKEEVAKNFCDCLSPKIENISLTVKGLLRGAVNDSDPSEYIKKELAIYGAGSDEASQSMFARIKDGLLSVISKGKGSILGDCVDKVKSDFGKKFDINDAAFMSDVAKQMKSDSCDFASLVIDFANKVR